VVTCLLSDASLLNGASARFAKISMHFKLPALGLEDIESHLKDIQCSESVIVIEFADQLILKQAKEKWNGLSEFIVVSSHPGCNGDGERTPYVFVFSIVFLYILGTSRGTELSLTNNRVSNVAYGTNGVTAVLSIERVEWKAAYNSMKVDFGMTHSSLYGQYSISSIRSHDGIRRRLGRRQVFPSSTSTFPSAPSTTPTSESSVHDIGFSKSDASIVSYSGVTIGCKNCSLVGTLEITQGTFTVNSSAANEFEEAYQFIEHGFFDYVGNGMSAHMELDTLVSFTSSFMGNVAVVTMPGFQASISFTFLYSSFNVTL
jgi:hypothetical protein